MGIIANLVKSAGTRNVKFAFFLTNSSHWPFLPLLWMFRYSNRKLIFSSPMRYQIRTMNLNTTNSMSTFPFMTPISKLTLRNQIASILNFEVFKFDTRHRIHILCFIVTQPRHRSIHTPSLSNHNPSKSVTHFNHIELSVLDYKPLISIPNLQSFKTEST